MLVINILEKQPAGFDAMVDFSHALETAINFNGFTNAELHRVTAMLSPFEDGKQSAWTKKIFALNKTW